jgi:hypothetical protein
VSQWFVDPNSTSTADHLSFDVGTVAESTPELGWTAHCVQIQDRFVPAETYSVVREVDDIGGIYWEIVVIWLPPQQVFRCSSRDLRVVVQEPKTRITGNAKDSTDHPCVVVVIND